LIPELGARAARLLEPNSQLTKGSQGSEGGKEFDVGGGATSAGCAVDAASCILGSEVISALVLRLSSLFSVDNMMTCAGISPNLTLLVYGGVQFQALVFHLTAKTRRLSDVL